MIRVFLAVELPSDMQEKLAHLQQQLQKTLSSINWVRPESIHLTLKFLGYIEVSTVPQLLSVLESVGGKREVFFLEAQGLGVFPHAKHPRILWVGLTGHTQALSDLVLDIDVALEPLGFPLEEKSYHPHLTLARIKRENATVGSVLLKNKVLEHDCHLGMLTIDRFTLVQSDLDSSGATYRSLGTVLLSEKTIEP